MSIGIGIHTMRAEVYHADPCPAPSLSASIASRICNESPLHAMSAHPRLTPAPLEENGEGLDLGTAAHMLLLERRAEVVIVDAHDWRKKAAQEQRDAARAAGQVPILARKWADVQAMAEAARRQLDAQLDEGAEMFLAGAPEQTLIWTEENEGHPPIWCRARVDYLRAGAIDDYKTTQASANPDSWTGRSFFDHGYDVQAAWYLRGLKALRGVDDAIFRFAVQEARPPYALAVVGLGPDVLTLAEKKILYALEAWRRGLELDRWPGYPRRTCYAQLPAWLEAAWLEKELQA